MKKKTVIKYFGGVTGTANVLGISKQAVSQWPDIVPINQAWKVERITGGKVAFRVNDYRMRAIK